MKTTMIPKTISMAFPALVAAIGCVFAAPNAYAAAVTPPDQPALVDTSSSAGSVVASSSSSATYSADHAFDGNWSGDAGRWLAYTNPDNDYGSGVHGEKPMYLVYKFNNPTKVNVLRLRTRTENEWDKRSPKAWTFLGSNDGTTWTQLDSRSGVAWTSGEAVSGLITKTFSFENRKSYEYYKFCCTEIVGENNYMQIYELQFLYNPGVVLTDLTTSSSGSVSASSPALSSYEASHAFDGNLEGSGRWLGKIDSTSNSRYLVWRFNEKTVVNAYRLFLPTAGGADYDARSPKDWTFDGSDDGDTWTTLDSQSGEPARAAGAKAYYQTSPINTRAYQYYRFNCTAICGNNEYIQLGEIEFYYVNLDGPMIGATTLSRTGAAAYSLTAVEDVNAADLSYILDNSETVLTNGTRSVAESGSATWSISGLAADKTYQVSVLAENASGLDETVAGTLYTGELTLGATTDASENGLVAGTVAVSRNSNDPFPLTVNYTISSSAPGAAEGTTWSAPTAVTIPAGETTGYLLVTPLVDPSVKEDVAVTVTLAAGNYEMPATVAKTLQIINLVAPSGYNTWVATSDGLASVDSNWSEGHAPTSSENVLFDGRFSTANCEWDSAAAATVASWTQTNGYTGTVTVDTVFPEKGSFTCLTVSGDMIVASGSVTHKSHNATYKVDTYRLRINVGGNLSVASGAKITAYGKGSYGPRSEGQSAYGGSYDGSPSWGSLTEPYGIGSSANDNGKYTCFAGGAIWIEVAGSTTLDGAINANGIATQGMYDKHAGSGGAIYLKTGTLAGVGKVSADCENTTAGSNNRSGAGGRVSILLTNGELDSFLDANITAIAGYSSYGNVGGTGTVLVRSPQKPNGVLYMRDRATKYGMYAYRPKPNQLARIPANQTWVLDEIVFGANAILEVPTGTTLDLRGGLESISSTGNTLDETGLIVDGGTLLLPAAETHTISGKWIFEPKDYTLAGNLVVTNGAGVGTLLLYSTTSNEVRTCGLTVSGNMHVASGSYLRAVRGGYIATGAATVGGTTPGCHGGQSAGGTANRAYDSFFHPRHPGAFGADNGRVNVGGGAIRLAVGGTLTLDGIATATPNVAENRSGAAGSIDITAARLEGAGRIEANGNSRNYSKDATGYGSGGGRIAVRLTGAGETFSSDWLTKINAKGFYSSKMTADYSSSAGSVYLQNAAQSEGTGTIIIRNTGDTANNVAFTAIPSTKGGGENDNFKKASLSIEAAARVKIFADLRMAALDMASATVLDLNGKTLVVNKANVGGTRLAPGSYTAGDEAVAGLVTDSASGGELVVSGGGLSIIVR